MWQLRHEGNRCCDRTMAQAASILDTKVGAVSLLLREAVNSSRAQFIALENTFNSGDMI